MFYFNYNFYISVDAIRKQVLNNLPSDVTDDSDTETLAKYSIKRFQKTENYSCYYNYWIKHEDNYESTEMGVMEFGIVRNNIYRLSVSKVAGLGSGDPYIEPEQPDEYKAELDININVFLLVPFSSKTRLVAMSMLALNITPVLYAFNCASTNIQFSRQ